MQTQGNKLSDKAWMGIIAALSLVVFLVIAVIIYKEQIFGISIDRSHIDPRIYLLPKLNAFLNGSVAVLITFGIIFIFNKNIRAHRACMLTAFTFSVLFLVSYIIYHSIAPETKFGGEGTIRSIYFFILLSHIILAAVIVPLALLTLYRIWRNDISRHKKIARWTFPIWLYVSVTGVIVYLMISPYYQV